MSLIYTTLYTAYSISVEWSASLYLSKLEIENFRIFGENDEKLILELQPGINLIVGENNSGKSAIVDALRLALGTRDHEVIRVNPFDFHIKNNKMAKRFTIRCTFDELDEDEAATFVEWLSIVKVGGTTRYQLTVTLEGNRKEESERNGRFDKLISLEWKAGPDIEGRALSR